MRRDKVALEGNCPRRNEGLLVALQVADLTEDGKSDERPPVSRPQANTIAKDLVRSKATGSAEVWQSIRVCFEPCALIAPSKFIRQSAVP